jgi:dipeptide/tripeptide permease
MSGDAGTVLGPIAAGLLVDSVSYPAAFILAAALLAAAALIAAATPEPRTGQPARPSTA